MDELSFIIFKKKVRNLKIDKTLYIGIIASLIVAGGVLFLVLPYKYDPYFDSQLWKELKLFFWGGLAILTIFLIFRMLNRKEIKGNLVLNENSIKSNWFSNPNGYGIENIQLIDYSYFPVGELDGSHWIKIILKADAEILNCRFEMEERYTQFFDYLKLYHTKGIRISINASDDYFTNGKEIKKYVDWNN